MAERRRRGARRRALLGLIAGSAIAAGSASVAHADPAGPTDYRSEVVTVEPSTPVIRPSIIGGDSFVELRVDEGTEVFVIGYEGEQYLWFRADGSVFENRNSPAVYLNEDRYGGGQIPPSATSDAAADWEQVASGGAWVWHDHRAHWMQSTPPIGLSPGDQILENVIPLTVDGAPVGVRVISTWLPDPSPLPAVFGALSGIVLALAGWALRRMGTPALCAALPVALAAAVIGAWQYWSLPAATGPRLVWVLLPTIALVCTIGGLVAGRRSAFVADAALLVVGVELAIWGFVKRDGLGAAIVPTDAPQWADRMVTAMALSGGVAFAGLALWWLFVAGGDRQRAHGADGLAAPGPPVSTS